MPVAAGGDLHYHLSQHGVFSEAEMRFYAAEIILGLEHMHSRFVVYRDLKVTAPMSTHPPTVRTSRGPTVLQVLWAPRTQQEAPRHYGHSWDPAFAPAPHVAPIPTCTGTPSPAAICARGPGWGSGAAPCPGSQQTSSWMSSDTSASQTWAWPVTSLRRNPTPVCECACHPRHPP